MRVHECACSIGLQGSFFQQVKIGFIGGSFDPIHFGHLCAAQDALEAMELDKVVFVPAAQSPLKSGVARASDAQRLALIRCALEGSPKYEVSDHELRKGGVSYTLESVRYFRQQYPHDRLFWIIGADQFSRLHLWHRIDELVRLVEFICLERPGHALVQPATLPGLRWQKCPGHLFEISSTEIRERAARGLPLNLFMPHKAVVYLRENALYP